MILSTGWDCEKFEFLFLPQISCVTLGESASLAVHHFLPSGCHSKSFFRFLNALSQLNLRYKVLCCI